MRLHATGVLLDADGALEVADGFAAQVVQESDDPILGEVLDVMGFRVQRPREVVVPHRNTHGDSGIDSSVTE